MQNDLYRLSIKDDIVVVCGHYEGVDHRFEKYIDEKVSIGDYILSGGELAAMVIVDGINRLIDGSISKESLNQESYDNNLLEYPQYTRPLEYDDDKVPFVLTNGNHKDIEKFNKKSTLLETIKYRKDLIYKHTFTSEEIDILLELIEEKI